MGGERVELRYASMAVDRSCKELEVLFKKVVHQRNKDYRRAEHTLLRAKVEEPRGGSREWWQRRRHMQLGKVPGAVERTELVRTPRRPHSNLRSAVTVVLISMEDTGCGNLIRDAHFIPCLAGRPCARKGHMRVHM